MFNIEELLDEYHNSETRTESMKKATPGKATRQVDEYMKGYVRVGGNYYSHSHPYLPHTDHKEKWDHTINVVIPLETTDPNATLVVFDQTWEQDSVTWCMHLPVMEFSTNTGVEGYPAEYNVNGLTGDEIDDELYENLTWLEKPMLTGLSGKAHKFIPGEPIIFNNKRIHVTGDLDGMKTGLSLRYKKEL